ncbi:MAG TPA: MOSC N-terminal beta barrel domain-containing protein [Ktedonobacteraceae bacterium]
MSDISTAVGQVATLWRYPIKSMLGEELNAATVTGEAILGDRAFALVDAETGKVASAKNPRKWPRLFDFRAAFVDPPVIETALPAVRVTLPDGRIVSTQQSDFNELLSQALERSITLSRATVPEPNLEEFWPEVEGITYNNKVTEEAMPANTFFDLAPIHILTTSTLDRLRELYPQGRFEVRRFRPNIVVQADEKDFIENAWVGRTLAIGDEVRLSVTSACPRCVMTTLQQGDLPGDLGILRTAARHNQAHVGVYATVLHGGIIHRNDVLRLV